MNAQEFAERIGSFVINADTRLTAGKTHGTRIESYLAQLGVAAETGVDRLAYFRGGTYRGLITITTLKQGRGFQFCLSFEHMRYNTVTCRPLSGESRVSHSAIENSWAVIVGELVPIPYKFNIMNEEFCKLSAEE